MKKIFYSIMSALLGMVALTSVLNLIGVSFEAIPFLNDLVNFLAIGIGGVSLAVVPAGAGSAEVTETAPGEPNGTTVVGGNVTATGAGGADVYNEPNYLEDDLDKQIVKIRPQDTPFDTFTRTIGNVVKSQSWEAGGWEIGTRETTDRLDSGASASATSFTVKNGDMWKPGDQFLVHTIGNEASGYADTGIKTDSAGPVSGIVKAVSGNTLTVQRVGLIGAAFPALDDESILQRLSPAVSELEASVEGYALQPSERHYYNQIHMCQVEESVIHSLLKKKVAMDFSVYKEQTLWDFKRGMELSNIFGVGGLSKNAKGEPVHHATGAWWQMDRQSTVDYSGMEDKDWNALGKSIFEGNNGAERRLFFAGNTLLELLATVPSYQKQLEAKNTEMVLGLRVFKIETPFGELLVKPLGNLFEGYFSKCGMVIDPNYVKKFVMEPLTTTTLDLDKTGQRRVENAVRVHETYSLFLENLPCHRRIVPAA